MTTIQPLLFVFILIPMLAHGNNLARDISATGDVESQSLIIPYGFYNDNTEVAAAMVFLNSGYFQPQAVTLFNAFAGSNSTYSVFAALKDFQVKPFDRLFVDTTLLVSS